VKLGILVTTDMHLGAVVGLTEAALAKGHEVTIFSMDKGSNLLAERSYSGLSQRDGVRMSYCEHNAKSTGIATEGLPAEIVSGSQYDNAVMNHGADKVIVL